MTARERVVGALAVIGGLVAALVLGLSLVSCYGGGTGNCVPVYYSQNGVSGVIVKCGSYWHEGGPTQS